MNTRNIFAGICLCVILILSGCKQGGGAAAGQDVEVTISSPSQADASSAPVLVKPEAPTINSSLELPPPPPGISSTVETTSSAQTEVPSATSSVDTGSGQSQDTTQDTHSANEPEEIPSEAQEQMLESSNQVSSSGGDQGTDLATSRESEDSDSTSSSQSESSQPKQNPIQVAAAVRADEAAIEDEVLRLLNEARIKSELDVLASDDTLRWAALIRAEESMEQTSHDRPDGTPYYTAMDEAGYVYAGKWHGENLCSLQSEGQQPESAQLAAQLFEQFQLSSGHSQNMMSANFDTVGIGISIKQTETGWKVSCTQMFTGE